MDVPATITAQEGRTLRTKLSATDPDGDPITFFVQRRPPYPQRLSQLARSVLSDHGAGTAELEFTPRHDEAGEYPLRVAAFDEVGGVTATNVTLVIEDTMPEGDANCDGCIDNEDVGALLTELFGDEGQAQCVSADTNDDGRLSVSDIVGLIVKLTR